jgi:membrane-bound lytic murein transglycosylase B
MYFQTIISSLKHKQMKKTILQLVKVLLLFFTFTLSNQIKAQTTATENSEEQGLSGVTDGNWRTFEGKVGTFLGTQGIAYATQVYLDVYLNNSATVTKRIIADVVIKNGTKYQIGDAKASALKNLDTISNLISVCTVNQKAIYPCINLETGYGTITKVIVKGGAGLANIQLAVDAPITLYTAAKTGVLFYVTQPAGAYSGNPFKRFMSLK